jgi:hypothetical protein
MLTVQITLNLMMSSVIYAAFGQAGTVPELFIRFATEGDRQLHVQVK